MREMNGDFIARTHIPGTTRARDEEEQQKNAQLIAAAPELLDALIRAQEWIATEPVEETLNDCDRETHAAVMDQMDRAIKKATV